MKKDQKKLSLEKMQVRKLVQTLTEDQMQAVNGGYDDPKATIAPTKTCSGTQTC